MRILLTLFCLLAFSVLSAQITDTPNQSKKIPALEIEKEIDLDDKDSNLTILETEAAPLALPVKKNTSALDLTEDTSKGFTMIQDNDLVDPGKIFEERFRKKKPIAELGMQYEKEMYFGEHKIQSEFVKIVFRDFAAQDGDVIRIFSNDDVIVPRAFLTNSYQAYKLVLKEGFNKIDFVALNQGESGPNTAQFLIVNDKDEIIYDNAWNLATGGKATIVFVKE